MIRKKIAGSDYPHHARLTSHESRVTSHFLMGDGPRQHPSGARHDRYRCSLPGLAGLTDVRRGGTDAGRHKLIQQLRLGGRLKPGGFKRARTIAEAEVVSSLWLGVAQI